MTKQKVRPLWTCPKCGAKLLTKNLWHSCGYATLDQWSRRMGPSARRLYDRFEQMIANCGEYHVSPAKTRITFLVRKLVKARIAENETMDRGGLCRNPGGVTQAQRETPSGDATLGGDPARHGDCPASIPGQQA